MRLKIEDIVVPQGRQPVADIDALASSVHEIGLLYPIIVTEDNVLVSGLRQLEACWQLGWEEVPVRVLSREELGRCYDELDNIVQRNLYTVLDRGELLVERQKKYVEKYPETARRGRRKANARPSFINLAAVQYPKSERKTRSNLAFLKEHNGFETSSEQNHDPMRKTDNVSVFPVATRSNEANSPSAPNPEMAAEEHLNPTHIVDNVSTIPVAPRSEDRQSSAVNHPRPQPADGE